MNVKGAKQRQADRRDGEEAPRAVVAFLRALAAGDDATLRRMALPETRPPGLAAIAPAVLAELGLEPVGAACAAEHFGKLVREAGASRLAIDITLEVPCPTGLAWRPEDVAAGPVVLRLTCYPPRPGESWRIGHRPDPMAWAGRRAMPWRPAEGARR